MVRKEMNGKVPHHKENQLLSNGKQNGKAPNSSGSVVTPLDSSRVTKRRNALLDFTRSTH